MPQEVIAGRYRIDKAIGQGGMGTVWLCQDELLHRQVAVKQIGNLAGDSADLARRAMREARTAAALNHRNAVSIYDVVDHEGAPWLVMEYVPSQTLGDLMADGPLPVERVAKFGAQVAAALASAHALGMIHRDVKPGNILIGEHDLAKISDFGIARLVYDDRLTQTGMVAGTPSYFSPELARGADPAPESDVWALGATLYAAVEGRTPYERRNNPIATLQAIASDPVERPIRAGALLEPIGHMMDRDPASRWSMAQAEAALRDIAEPVPAEPTSVFAAPPVDPTPEQTPSPPPTPPAPPARAGQRRWVLPLVLGVAALVVLVGGAILLVNLLGGDDANDPTQAGPTQSPGDPAESPDEAPQQSPDEENQTTPPPDDEPPVGSEAARIGAIESYFNVVPDDLDAGFALLSPRFQAEVGRESYDGFWGSIADVSVANVRTQGNAVIADITYVTDDGEQTETHRLSLVRQGSSYLIDGDEAIG